MNIVNNIYSWLNPLYSIELYEYLKGNDCNGYLNGTNHLLTIGLGMLVITFFLTIAYYYFINHPRFNRWWHWIIFLLITGTTNLLLGYGYIYTKLHNGLIPACYTHSEIQTAEDGSIYGVNGSEILSSLNCWQFGIANAIIAITFFFIFSFVVKWWSQNCKHSPFF